MERCDGRSLDAEWLALSSALAEVRLGTGRPLVDERPTIEAVVWRLRNRVRWCAVPAEFGPWHRAAQLHDHWTQMSIWSRLFALLRDRGQPELAEVFLGDTVRAHQKAAGPKGELRSGARSLAQRVRHQVLRDLRCSRATARLRAAARPNSLTQGRAGAARHRLYARALASRRRRSGLCVRCLACRNPRCRR